MFPHPFPAVQFGKIEIAIVYPAYRKPVVVGLASHVLHLQQEAMVDIFFKIGCHGLELVYLEFLPSQYQKYREESLDEKGPVPGIGMQAPRVGQRRVHGLLGRQRQVLLRLLEDAAYEREVFVPKMCVGDEVVGGGEVPGRVKGEQQLFIEADGTKKCFGQFDEVGMGSLTLQPKIMKRGFGVRAGVAKVTVVARVGFDDAENILAPQPGLLKEFPG